MKTLLAASLLVALTLGAGSAAAGTADTMASASAQAATSGQPILLEIGTSW